jgi:hypothetical protein
LHRRVTALAAQGRYEIPKLLEAIHTFEHGRGGHSWLERRFLVLVEQAGLPRPTTQQVLTRADDRSTSRTPSSPNSAERCHDPPDLALVLSHDIGRIALVLVTQNDDSGSLFHIGVNPLVACEGTGGVRTNYVGAHE